MNKADIFSLVLLIIAAILIVVMLASFVIVPLHNAGSGTYLVTDKTIRQNSDGHYLVFAQDVNTGEKEVFEIRDTWLNGIFNASDIYGDVEVGATYTFVLKGYRIPFFSWYKMIVSYERV